MEPAKVIARAESVRGEVVLQRRMSAAGEIDELIINGAFAMDSAETGSERELGRLAGDARRVLLGGLGLGYTAAEALNNPIERLDIVELEGCLVDWAESGRTEVLRRVATDPRVRFHVGDIVNVLAQRSAIGPWNAILLDVDNGPDFLIHPQNASLYARPLLASAYGQLAPGGLLAIWCQGESPPLEATLSELWPAVQALPIPCQRGERRFSYVIYILRRPVSGAAVH